MANSLVAEVIKKTNVQPRPYQRRIVTKALDMYQGRYKNGADTLEPNARSILIESPTGSGKTVYAGKLTDVFARVMKERKRFNWCYQ